MIGYARVSTADQNLGRQIVALQSHGVDKVFTEKRSGIDNDRPVLQTAIRELAKGDVLVVQSMERLSRDQAFLKELFIRVYLKKAEIEILDIPTFEELPNKNIQSLIRAWLIEFKKFFAAEELRTISERQRQGIALAKLKGVYKGRPQKYRLTSPNQADVATYKAIAAMLNANRTIAAIMAATGVSNTVVYRIKAELQQAHGVADRK